MRTRAKHGRLNVSVEARPSPARMEYQPFGDSYVRSVWRDLDGFAPEDADLMLRDEGGRWFWSGVVYYRGPRP